MCGQWGAERGWLGVHALHRARPARRAPLAKSLTKSISLSARPPRHRHRARSAARGTRTSCALFVLDPSARMFELAPFEEASRRAACARAAVLKRWVGKSRAAGSWRPSYLRLRQDRLKCDISVGRYVCLTARFSDSGCTPGRVRIVHFLNVPRASRGLCVSGS